MMIIIVVFCIVLAFGWYGSLIGHLIYRVIKCQTPLVMCTMTNEKTVWEAARKTAEIEWKRRLAANKGGAL